MYRFQTFVRYISTQLFKKHLLFIDRITKNGKTINRIGKVEKAREKERERRNKIDIPCDTTSRKYLDKVGRR